MSTDGHLVEGIALFAVTVGAEKPETDTSAIEEDRSAESIEPSTSPTPP